MATTRQNPNSDERDDLLPNSAADEFFVRMKHDFRRPKPSPEAVASALQAIQKVAGETALGRFDGTAPQIAGEKCPKCGEAHSGSNRFCGYCGTLLPLPSKAKSDQLSSSSSPQGQHVIHHHYHHHYFPESGGVISPNGAPSSDSGSDAALPEETLSGPPDSETAIQRLVQEWSVRFNSKRLGDLVELYSTDAIVLRPNSPPAHGAPAIRQLLQAARDGGLGDVELDCADIGIVGDFACLTGHSKMLVPVGAAKRHERAGKYLIVARRERDDWKIVADSWCMDAVSSENVNPQPAIPAPVLPMRAPVK
jgi:ketosteroid isomerase-like protein